MALFQPNKHRLTRLPVLLGAIRPKACFSRREKRAFCAKTNPNEAKRTPSVAPAAASARLDHIQHTPWSEKPGLIFFGRFSATRWDNDLRPSGPEMDHWRAPRRGHAPYIRRRTLRPARLAVGERAAWTAQQKWRNEPNATGTPRSPASGGGSNVAARRTWASPCSPSSYAPYGRPHWHCPDPATGGYPYCRPTRRQSPEQRGRPMTIRQRVYRLLRSNHAAAARRPHGQPVHPGPHRPERGGDRPGISPGDPGGLGRGSSPPSRSSAWRCSRWSTCCGCGPAWRTRGTPTRCWAGCGPPRRPMQIIDLLAILPFYLPFVQRGLLLPAGPCGCSGSSARQGRAVLRRPADRRAGHPGTPRTQWPWRPSPWPWCWSLASMSMYYARTTPSRRRSPASRTPCGGRWPRMTTVGYGDIYPITPLGKLVGSIVAFAGIGMFALPTAILGAGFLEELQRRHARATRCPHCGRRSPPPTCGSP